MDINTWGAMAAAESWGGPWAAFAPFPLPLSSRDVAAVRAGPRSRLGARRTDPRLVARPVVLRVVERENRPKVNAIRAGVGLPPLPKLDALYRTRRSSST